MSAADGVYAINLLGLRPGVDVRRFERFSAELDQPVCLAQDVVEGFDAFAVTHRTEAAPSVDIVEVMHVRSWKEWERVRDGLEALEPVTAAFDELVEPSTVRTLFGRRIGRR
jgi:hypothetical protein